MSYLINFIGKRKQTQFGMLFSQTASVTIANTVTETALSSAGVGSLVLPANFLTVGKSIAIWCYGIHSSSGNPTATVKVKLNSTVIGQATGTSGNGSVDGFEISSFLTVRSIGVSGTIFGQGRYFEEQNNGLATAFKNTSTTTIDTTIAQTMSITFQWGTASASNTITATNLTITCMN
jgi:hypothetical protein